MSAHAWWCSCGDCAKKRAEFADDEPDPPMQMTAREQDREADRYHGERQSQLDRQRP